MEKTGKKTTKKSVPLFDKIKTAYIDHVLTHGKEPASVFLFAKNNKMKEDDFYEHFSSFESLNKGIWKSFFDEVITRLQAETIYSDYSAREKLLAFYFTWIEVLKSNRSYVRWSIEQSKRPETNPKNLSSFKKAFLQYVEDLLNEGKETEEVLNRPVISDRYKDGIWIQTLFILNFWLRDESSSFEKTDAIIEKLVNLAFELMGKSPLDSMVDLAKFLYQNR